MDSPPGEPGTSEQSQELSSGELRIQCEEGVVSSRARAALPRSLLPRKYVIRQTGLLRSSKPDRRPCAANLSAHGSLTAPPKRDQVGGPAPSTRRVNTTATPQLRTNQQWRLYAPRQTASCTFPQRRYGKNLVPAPSMVTWHEPVCVPAARSAASWEPSTVMRTGFACFSTAIRAAGTWLPWGGRKGGLGGNQEPGRDFPGPGGFRVSPQ